MAGRQLSHRNEGSATLGTARTRIPQQGLAGGGLAVIAFLCYYATLVPGLDLGDSASFQTGIGSLDLTPRQAYPLYYGLGNVFAWLHGGEPARALNLASAVYAAAAVGLAVLLAGRLFHSVIAGAGAGLFLAFSYTFWTQAVTAEVYTLHLLIMGAAGISLLAWSDRPTVGRLALFYAIVALGFGNHLSMVLLLPAFAVFLVTSRKPGDADPIRLRMILMAVAIAMLGALQYAWNFRGLWADLEPPPTLIDAVRMFWFDVTKEDWRETLIMTVSETGLQYRPAMYWFDLRQQFGVPGVVLASLGSAYALVHWPRRALLLAILYAVNIVFAWNYNVGDAYIFFLPSHYVVALCAGAGIAAVTALCSRLSHRSVATAAGALLLMYPAWRGYDTFPAVDRSWDNRAVKLLEEFTTPRRPILSRPEDTVYGFDSNWQVQNAVEYFMRERKPAIAWFTTDQLEWLDHPNRVENVRRFAADNARAGRPVIVSAQAADRLMGVYPQNENFSNRVESVHLGTPYVLAVLRTDREYSLNTTGLAEAWRYLAPGVTMPALRQFTVIVGRAGEGPVLVESQDRPFRTSVRIEPYDLDLRMESWLPTDTIRRAGFGHVVANRHHILTLERGISFIALGSEGGPIYESGLFAPMLRLPLEPNP